MSLSTVASTERRTTNTSDWLVTLCAEFSAATRWELKFFPERPREQDGFDRRELDWCWHTEITDGDQRIGAFIGRAYVHGGVGACGGMLVAF